MLIYAMRQYAIQNMRQYALTMNLNIQKYYSRVYNHDSYKYDEFLKYV